MIIQIISFSIIKHLISHRSLCGHILVPCQCRLNCTYWLSLVTWPTLNNPLRGLTWIMLWPLMPNIILCVR